MGKYKLAFEIIELASKRKLTAVDFFCVIAAASAIYGDATGNRKASYDMLRDILDATEETPPLVRVAQQ